jgi:hypothetical protein
MKNYFIGAFSYEGHGQGSRMGKVIRMFNIPPKGKSHGNYTIFIGYEIIEEVSNGHASSLSGIPVVFNLQNDPPVVVFNPPEEVPQKEVGEWKRGKNDCSSFRKTSHPLVQEISKTFNLKYGKHDFILKKISSVGFNYSVYQLIPKS